MSCLDIGGHGSLLEFRSALEFHGLSDLNRVNMTIMYNNSSNIIPPPGTKGVFDASFVALVKNKRPLL